ncbi:MAG: methionyl-tRNA formyltransferase, partial [Rickettsiales bacterium]|nr:methionyl-tRNA formyltransferase [Rickettsiales bacterium]
MKIIFMGASNFSLPALGQLAASRHEIVGVFTKKPKKANRGQKLSFSPVYKFAEKNNLKIFMPATFKNEKNASLARNLDADLITVVSYGLILSESVLRGTKYGAINIHPSLLPRWRGSAPIERALLAGDEETGVCIMEMSEGVDSGRIIDCERVKITRETDLESLSRQLSEIGARLLMKAIAEIEKTGKILGREQGEDGAIFAEKITKEDAKINWLTDSVAVIHRKIIALGKTPGIFIKLGGNRIKILKADFELGECADKNKIGAVTDKKNFFIQCADGILKP